MLDQLNEDAQRSGGQWVKLHATGDTISGVLLDAEKRGKTFEGAPVLSRKSGEQRIEYVLTIQTDERDPNIDDDDGVRKVSANESMQRAVFDAIKKSGGKATPGCRIAIQVAEAAASTTEQARYTAAIKPGEIITVPERTEPAPSVDDLI